MLKGFRETYSHIQMLSFSVKALQTFRASLNKNRIKKTQDCWALADFLASVFNEGCSVLEFTESIKMCKLVSFNPKRTQ